MDFWLKLKGRIQKYLKPDQIDPENIEDLFKVLDPDLCLDFQSLAAGYGAFCYVCGCKATRKIDLFKFGARDHRYVPQFFTCEDPQCLKQGVLHLKEYCQKREIKLLSRL